MKPPIYYEGPEAKEKFEKAMAVLFSTPKAPITPRAKPERKKAVKPAKD